MKVVGSVFLSVLAVSVFTMAPSGISSAQTVMWDFSLETTDGGYAPVRPKIATLAGSENDWILDGNPQGVTQWETSVFVAARLDEGYLNFWDPINQGNVSLVTSNNAAIRPEYKLTGPEDRIWLICDHQVVDYGRRANNEPGSIDRTRGQLFYLSFLTSDETHLGVQFVAANYNTEGHTFFTAIGNSDENQDAYLENNRLIEDFGDRPNTNRRTVTIRVTENAEPEATVTVEVKFDNGPYRVIDTEFSGPNTLNYAAGNYAGAENILAVIGNNSGSGAIEFNMWRLEFTKQAPEGEETEIDRV